ncbi:MAG: nitronate monooxygenase [Nitrospinota bacterium]|nr:nitronate monooxygenase [Nitrospinota bacterium]
MIVTPFTEQVGIEVPLICGAMYPCSNPELVAEVSKAGGIGIIQPVSMTFVYGHTLREGIRYIRTLTNKPIGFNALVEDSSRRYMNRMRMWVDIALEENVRFFITALGKPKWVVDKVHQAGGIVYHDATNRKWALKALESEVDGLICVNNRAGGHAGKESAEKMYDDLKDLGVPLICAGGIGNEADFKAALDLGYAGVQMGTRFIATKECNVHDDYKNAILNAKEKDIVLTDKISGVPVSVIRTPFVDKTGTEANWIVKLLLRDKSIKRWMRMFYTLRSIFHLKKASQQGSGYRDYFQAGKSVEKIDSIEPAGEVVKRFASFVSKVDAKKKA